MKQENKFNILKDKNGVIRFQDENRKFVSEGNPIINFNVPEKLMFIPMSWYEELSTGNYIKLKDGWVSKIDETWKLKYKYKSERFSDIFTPNFNLSVLDDKFTFSSFENEIYSEQHFGEHYYFTSAQSSYFEEGHYSSGFDSFEYRDGSTLITARNIKPSEYVENIEERLESPKLREIAQKIIQDGLQSSFEITSVHYGSNSEIVRNSYKPINGMSVSEFHKVMEALEYVQGTMPKSIDAINDKDIQEFFKEKNIENASVYFESLEQKMPEWNNLFSNQGFRNSQVKHYKKKWYNNVPLR